MKLATLALLAGATVLSAAEGKWTPGQILQLDPAWLKQQGLEILPQKLWDPASGTGLLSGVINTGGCSGSFISSTGLFITNHHCLFAVVQEHSTAARDLITDGFLAGSPAEELRSKSARITVPRRFTDVTREVLAAVPPGASDLQRFRAIEARQKQLVAACERQTDHRCRVAAFDGGVTYSLVDTVEISDVRLVFAPARAVGEFGGEVDNFAWPRHTGDFAIGRAYVDGQPYHPQFYFPLARTGVKPGDFVMVMGYPGTTFRALTAAEVAERRDLYFTRRVDVYGEWIRALEESTAHHPAGAIAVAAHLKGLNNRLKNAQGQLAGLARGQILEKRQAAERALVAWASSRPGYRNALTARDELQRLVEEQRRTWERDFLLDTLPVGSKALYFATTLVRTAYERQKPDLERDPEYMERQLPRLRDRLEREQKNYFEAADKRLFESFVRRALALGEGERIAAIESEFRQRPDRRAAIDAAYARTGVLTPERRLRLSSETPDELRAHHDPLLNLALALYPELEALKERQNRMAGAVSRLRPQWQRAVIAQAGAPVAPDANSTLRVTVAHVAGYSPRDAVLYQPQSTLSGMLEKHTGQEPFNAPADVLAAARARDFGRWADPQLGDIPVDFLADADTTGGNSGSPTVNGKGELVGVNFDRVWENVANDFGYNPAVARNVNADIRYCLWLLDRVKHGTRLLEELGVGRE
jgi:hypothetical protein